MKWLVLIRQFGIKQWEELLPLMANDAGVTKKNGRQSLALLHERTDGEPKAVEQSELILHHIGIDIARMWVVPLVRAESSQHEEHETDS